MNISKRLLSEPYKEFLKKNGIKMDKLVNRIMWAMLFVPFAVAIGIYFDAYTHITYTSCIIDMVTIIAFCSIHSILLKTIPGSWPIRYVGLCAMQLLVMLMKTWGFGIYITCFFIPVFSLFYCDLITYVFSCIFTFITIGVAYYIYAPFRITLYTVDVTVSEYFFGFMGGLFIEYIFCFVAGLMVQSLIIKYLDILYGNQVTISEKEQDGFKDQLTGLWNNNYMEKTVEKLVFIQNHESAMMVLDLDNFKQINDLYGHSEGDRALKILTSILTHSFRAADNVIISRYGGDEFIILLPLVTDEKTLEICIKRLMRSFGMIFNADPHFANVTLSIGAAFGIRDGIDFTSLFRSADNALLYVKRTGKNNYHIYHHDDPEEFEQKGRE